MDKLVTDVLISTGECDECMIPYLENDNTFGGVFFFKCVILSSFSSSSFSWFGICEDELSSFMFIQYIC